MLKLYHNSEKKKGAVDNFKRASVSLPDNELIPAAINWYLPQGKPWTLQVPRPASTRIEASKPRGIKPICCRRSLGNVPRGGHFARFARQ